MSSRRGEICFLSYPVRWAIVVVVTLIAATAIVGLVFGVISFENDQDLKHALKKVASAAAAASGVGAQAASASASPSSSPIPVSPSSSGVPASPSAMPNSCPAGGLAALCSVTSANTACCTANSAAIASLDSRVTNTEVAITNLVVDVDDLFADVATLDAEIVEVNTTVHSIVNGSAADYQHVTHRTLLPCRDVLKMATDIVTAYYNDLSWMTVSVPLDDWTGGSVVDRFVLPPLVQLTPAEMSPDELFEAIIALSMRAYIQCVPTARSQFGQDDCQDAGRLHDEHAVEVFAGMVELLRKLGGDVDEDYNFFGEPVALDRVLAVRLAIDITVSVGEWFSNSNLMTEQITFSQFYSGNKHRYISQALHWDIFQGAYVSWVPEIWGMQGLTMYWPRTMPLSFWSATEKEALLLAPEAVAATGRIWAQAADNERAAIDSYFNPIYFLDPNQAVIFLNATDPEGLARQSDQTATLWIGQGNQIDLSFWQPQDPSGPPRSYLRPFKQLEVLDKSGNPDLVYKHTGGNAAIFFNFQEVLDYHFGAQAGAQLADRWAYAWDNHVLPEVKRFASAVTDRFVPAHMSNDHYTGHWRGAHRYVSLVERNTTSGRAVAYRVPYNDANPTGPQLRIPLNPADNAAFATLQAPLLSTTTGALTARFVAAQAKIADLERWLASDLENAVSAHVGDIYLVLQKNNHSMGISAGNPYTDVQQIITNYVAQENVVEPYGQSKDIVELVSQSGAQLATLFFDIRELLADQLVKERYTTFGFASSASAGLYKLNTTGQNITLELVQAYSQNSAVADAKSDLDCLGRHYGYTVTGAINASEPVAPAPYVYHGCMDYIYAQHYAIDTTLPRVPTNVFDPVTGKFKYQYTDVGDTVRRAAFLNAFRALEATTTGQLQTKRGTYMRFIMDHHFQTVARYVVDTAVANRLLSQSFSDQYFNSTVIKTFDPATIAATGPERVVYRVRGQLSGSANSGTTLDLVRRYVNITIAFTTVIPFVATSELGTMLHEGALGHGFDKVPNLVDFLRGIVPVTGWPTTTFSTGIVDDGVATYGIPGPSYASLAEGWATLGEVIGMINKYYVNFDAQGNVIPNTQDTVAALNAIISLSRIAARQYCAMGTNFARNGWSFNRLVTTFKQLTGFSTQTAVNFVDRFYLHPMQQTSYANGFITNVGLISYLSNALAAECYCFDLAKFIEFRITRTDYIAGASLFEIATQNIYTFRTDDLLPCPGAPPCAKKRSLPAHTEERGLRTWHHHNVEARAEHEARSLADLLPIKHRKISVNEQHAILFRDMEHVI